MRRLCLVSIVITSITGQRRQFIADLIKTNPPRQSISPSWSSDRQFDVIGAGPLPLQNHNLEKNFQTGLSETQYIPASVPSTARSRYESDRNSGRPSRRNKRSPYKRIKLKIPNPFYYPGSRRQIWVKNKVIPADPVYHRKTSRSYNQHDVGAGYHRLWNDDDDHL